MRPLNSNEKRLLALFALAILVMANLIGLSYYKRMTTGMQLEQAELNALKMEATVWGSEVELWAARKAWLDENQPRQPLDGTANSALLEMIQQTASAQNVTIMDQSLPEPVDTQFYKEVSVRLRVSATLEQLTRWLAEIQAPESFQAITSFNIRSDKEPPKIICDLQIARWYAP
jgi:Tfp pilus assembly protein PilO